MGSQDQDNCKRTQYSLWPLVRNQVPLCVLPTGTRDLFSHPNAVSFYCACHEEWLLSKPLLTPTPNCNWSKPSRYSRVTLEYLDSVWVRLLSDSVQPLNKFFCCCQMQSHFHCWYDGGSYPCQMCEIDILYAIVLHQYKDVLKTHTGWC